MARSSWKWLPTSEPFPAMVSRRTVVVCSSVRTVSYTHLDVYKRQALPDTTMIAASAALTASSTSPTKSKYPGVSRICLLYTSYINIVAIAGNIVEGLGLHLHFGAFFVSVMAFHVAVLHQLFLDLGKVAFLSGNTVSYTHLENT